MPSAVKRLLFSKLLSNATTIYWLSKAMAAANRQETLWEEVQCAFKANAGLSAEEEWCYDRARFEQRRCRILVAAQVLDNCFIEQWPGLQTIV
ncbi:hypothetical protein GCM10028810_28300 [Spirosoma litoris]